MASTDLHRILDASLNRAGEGLRVVEDYVRFVLGDPHLTSLVKQLRHDLAAAEAPLTVRDRYVARDTLGDVGTALSTPSEARRPDAWSVCQASLERSKQSLRSLEEYGKVLAPSLGTEFGLQFEALRYRLYTIEAALGRTVDAIDRLAHVRLCVLVDGGPSEEAFTALVSELMAAGVGAIQLRDKALPVRRLVDRARLLVQTVRASITQPPPSRDQAWPRLERQASPPPPLVIINDRPAVAAAVDADGVHLGQDDMTVRDARAILGPHRLIGASTHSIEQARQAVLDGANYLGVGPTFPSGTKQFDAFPGTRLLAEVAKEIALPAFAIGGIKAGNLAEVLAAGATRIAVASAVTDASSPGAAARDLINALETRPPKGI